MMSENKVIAIAVEKAMAHAEEIYARTYPSPDFATPEDADLAYLAYEVRRLRALVNTNGSTSQRDVKQTR